MSAVGWRLAPAAATVAIRLWVWTTSRLLGGGYGAIGAGLYEMIRVLLGPVATLVVWLVAVSALWWMS